LDDLIPRRHDAQEGKRTTVGNHLPVHEHFEFAISAVHRVNVDRQLSPYAIRHPDGMNSRDSV